MFSDVPVSGVLTAQTFFVLTVGQLSSVTGHTHILILHNFLSNSIKDHVVRLSKNMKFSKNPENFYKSSISCEYLFASTLNHKKVVCRKTLG